MTRRAGNSVLKIPNHTNRAAHPKIATSRTDTSASSTFGRDVCELSTSLSKGAIGAVISAPIVCAAAFAGSLRNLPRMTNEVWQAARKPGQNIILSGLKQTNAAVTTVTLALSPVVFGLAGLAVGAHFGAVQAPHQGWGDNVSFARELAGAVGKMIDTMHLPPEFCSVK